MPPSSSILYENAARTVVVVDVPRSIEEAQELDDTKAGRRGPHANPPGRQRLLSTVPPAVPFTAPPEPRRGAAGCNSTDMTTQLAELTTAATVTSALDELHGRAGFHGPWCLPRCCVPPSPSPTTSIATPPGAHYLASTISAGRDRFLAEAPLFDLVVIDPPWPNRSARRRWQGRKRRRAACSRGGDREGGDSPEGETSTDTGYSTAPDMAAVQALLEQVPVGAKLADDAALVAVWVTNKPACAALLTDPKHGLFRAWGVELVATWTWLKVTTAGVPVVPVDALWRKPWERLLLARRCGGPTAADSAVPTRPRLPPDRVLVGVPDVHSRKPNLRPLLAPFLTTSRRGDTTAAVGLEVFARNLTAGWWAWGDEVLLFQQASWWTADGQEEDDGRRAHVKSKRPHADLASSA